MKLTVFLRPCRYKGRGEMGGKELMRNRQLVICICSSLSLKMLQLLSWGFLSLYFFAAFTILLDSLKMIKLLINSGF
ncbi:E8 [Bos taurus papillomavirus 2]|uniref:E8 n=1 Tax=Bos taurus papillomavirus 2 TaxID=2758382 RepID=A0A165XUP9_BPV2|nr:E8 [Bos taurus papillomavirus 2]AZB49457.1 E8 [Bos taurus papillomavirus 2]WMH03912.1 E8 protein [Bos taurus papillomavirus 2]